MPLDSSLFTKLILEHFKESVVVLNDARCIIFTNAIFEKLMGVKKEELLNKPITDLVVGDDLFDEKLGIAAQSEARVYTYLKSQNRHSLNVRIRVTKIKQEDGKNYFLLHVKDNTKNKIIDYEILRKTLTVETLSKSRKIRDGKFSEAIFEILGMASLSTGAERVNAWLFDENKTKIKCIGNYDYRTKQLVPQTDLPRINMPNYFRLFESEKIILSNDTINDAKMVELLALYVIPNGIKAMMDIPIRIEGEIIGVVCFEEIEGPRIWRIQDQQFALIIAQMISLALETYEKLNTRKDLEQSLKEQKTLLREIHHRVKNNLAIMTSLVNLQSDRVKDPYHQSLFTDTKNRIASMASVHEVLYKSKNLSNINFKAFLATVLVQLQGSFHNPEKKIILESDIESIDLNISNAIPLALIVNELITNCYKHAFKNQNEGLIHIGLKDNFGFITLVVKDNGSGYNPDEVNHSDSLGLDIYNGLVEQINGQSFYNNDNGSEHRIVFENTSMDLI
jgi:PAS domain S-box-containing protein